MSKLKLKTLSPIHIGNGEKYNAVSYILNRRVTPNEICFVNLDDIKAVLTPQQLENFINYLSEVSRPSLFNFFSNKLKETNFQYTNRLITKSKSRLKFVSDNIPNEIECFIKANNMVYIPGSEIKGAIRTAILFHLLSQNGNYNNFIALLNSNKNFANNRDERLRKKIVVKFNDYLESLIRSGKDARYDLLKCLYISDSEPMDCSECLYVANIETLNVSRRFFLYQELCKPECEFSLYNFTLKNEPFYLNTLGFNPLQQSIIQSIDNIFKLCYEFTSIILQYEISEFKKLNRNDVVQHLQKIMEQNQPNSPVIRIGKNEGFLSITINLLLKQKNEELYKNVIFPLLRKRGNKENFPKTRRIVKAPDNKYYTLGWVKILKAS